jgi:hypothetical protein
MTKAGLKALRRQFRTLVLQRANYRCEVCGRAGHDRQAGGEGTALDAHHITDRHQMPSGGYTPWNGISVCDRCHRKAEAFHGSGRGEPGYSPEELYRLVGSSLEKAKSESEALPRSTP